MDGPSAPILRRHFLNMAGTALAVPAILRVSNAQPSPSAPKLTTLLRADLQGQDQTVQETLINLLDLAPAASAPWHVHPGAQEIVFVLDGTVVVEVGSEEPKELGPGGLTLIAAETPHLVRNKSATTTARAFNVYSRADKQKPFLVVLKRAT
jgi:quercetin dioxygenase-like cupin family protein